MLPLPQVALLVVAAIAAGAQNAVAGGGSFFTFPALLFIGVAAKVANATNTVALWPAGIGSAFAYRDDLKHERRVLYPLLAASLAGGLVGALVLVKTPERTFSALIPWLLATATVIFALGPLVQKRLRARDLHVPLVAIVAVQFVVAVYGGYFGGGMGILMLAALAALGMEDIHAMNALKVVLGLVINGVAIVAFLLAGLVDWPLGILMAVASTGAGYGGARLAKRVDARYVRWFIILVGAALTFYFFLR